MIESPYAPDAGDLIWTDFNPRVGREQSGRRPALVLSPATLFMASAFVIVCPITKTVRAFGSSVLLPPGLVIEGEVLTYQVRGIDTLARPIRYAGSAVSTVTLIEVRAKLGTLCGFTL